MPDVVKNTAALMIALFAATGSVTAHSTETLPIADAHIHYSHDSVKMTPPERVIEIMRTANLKFALVSSSDDNGTQLLSELAPDLIVPGLRPYRRRGELSTWFRDPIALAYVEKLLKTNRYATIGEFHLYGDEADLPLPRRIVELAAQHNLILHAHSDSDAVERLLAQNPDVKVLWAHSGFDSPGEIARMLDKHDRLWGDLAFRSEVGSGGRLSQEWQDLFVQHPTRIMLGTDTYTPERMYYIPDHAETSRTWLATLPDELAENLAWKNAWNLLMPVWQKNRQQHSPDKNCSSVNETDMLIENGDIAVRIEPQSDITVSQPFSARISVCGQQLDNATVTLDARMPAHGHGMNYRPEHSVLEAASEQVDVQVDGLVLHMPGNWEWIVEVKSDAGITKLTREFTLQ